MGSLLRGLKIVWLNLAILVTAFVAIEVLAFLYHAAHEIGAAIIHRLTGDSAKPAPANADLEPPWDDADHKEFYATRVRWTPYVYWRRVPFKGTFITVDDEGLRATWNEPAVAGNKDAGNKEDVVQVAVFGGSAVWGQDARDDFTIPSQLSKLIASEHPRQFHVTNYGESGYVSTQSALFLLRLIHTGHIPDIVVFYEGYNDVFAAYQSRVAGVPVNEQHRMQEFNLLNTSRSWDLYHEILKRTHTSAIAKGIRRRITGDRSEEPLPLSREESEMLSRDLVGVYAKNMELVASMAKTWGFECRFYWQPTFFTTGTAYAHNQPALPPPPSPPEFAEFVRQTMKEIEKSGLETRHPDFLNLSGVLDTYDKAAFMDEVHTTEAANGYIAKRMVSDLTGLLAERAARH